jgi:mono/diheme cytochrome c family protein
MKEAAPAPDKASQETIPPLVESSAVQAMGRVFYDPPQSETTLFRVPALNATFALSSAILFGVTVWAIWQDHSRDWKVFNSEWRRIQTDRYRQQISEENRRLQSEQLAEKEAELSRLRATLVSSSSYEKLLADSRRAANEADMADVAQRFHKSKLDSQRYYFEEERKKILDGPLKDTPRGQEELEKLETRFEKEWIVPYERLLRVAEEKLQVAKDLADKAAVESKGRDDIDKQIAALVRSRDMLQRNLRQVEASAANAIRNAPLLPPFSPTDKIEKVVIADLTEPLNFLDVPRVDRCKTCHLNIDNPDPSVADVTAERSRHQGRLFRSHPRPDLYVGSASPHPYEQFGCTICHYGDGHSTSFEFAAHTPRDHHQEREWEEKYGWHHLHHQDYPMLPMTHIASTCAKCHPNQDRIQGADLYNAGRDLVEKYGCFGCHKIQGFEKYRKVGPNLQRIGDKTTREFVYRWVKDPPGFRPTTRMPKFFDLANSNGVMDVVNMQGQLEPMRFDLRNEMEALSLATYLHGRSQPRPGDDFYRLKAGPGDPGRGKELVKKVGCLGCHSIVREGFTQNDHGPDLSSIGSKVRPEWLVDWIVHPQKHDPQSRMPRLRIESDEGGEQKLADIVAYLMTLKDQRFEEQPVPKVDEDRLKILKEIGFDYLRRNSTRAEARESVEKMSEDGLLAYCGERLVQRHGCFGCHLGISPDFDKATPIGTELSFHGSKEIDKLDFAKWGHQSNGESAVPHSREGWFSFKLTNPRLYDTIPKEVKRSDGRVGFEPTEKIVQKTPEELLKMPLFSFRTIQDPADGSNPEDAAKIAANRGKRIEAVVDFLLSRLNDKIPLQKTRRLGPDEEAVEMGRNLVRFLNCQGCHRLGADPQELSIDALPAFSYDVPDDQKVFNVIEKETWLAENVKLGKMTIPAGTFLSTELWDENDPQSTEQFSVRMVATRHWERTKTPERERRLKVLGFGEGKVRRYFGDTDEARPTAPPLLRKEGERVNSEWLFKFLLDVKPLRTWLDIRMPSFNLSPAEATAIVRWFKLTAGAPYLPLGLKDKEQVAQLNRWYGIQEGVPYPPIDLNQEGSKKLADWLGTRGLPPYPLEVFPEHDLTPRQRELAELGREMFKVTFPGDQNANLRLQCNACHPAGNAKPSNPDPTNWGPDLGLARDRLRPNWTGRWLLDPGSYLPGTKMPNNFIGYRFGDTAAEGLRLEVQRPEYQKEVEALIQYLMHMRQLDSGSTARR